MFSKFVKFAKEHRLGCTLAMIALSILLALLPQLFYEKLCPENTNISRVELLVFSSQILSSLYVITGTIIAVWQYYISSTHKIIQMNRCSIERAVELAGYYKDNIISGFSIIKNVSKRAGIYDIMIKHLDEMNCFDVWENEKLFSKEEQEQIANGRISAVCFDTIVIANKTYGLNLFDNTLDVSKLSEKEKETICNKFWANMGANVLNNAEYFAMHFSHELADDTVIYQSIYPSYLEMCCILYTDIVRCRNPQRAKLYSNVVHLFTIWKDTSAKQKEIAIKMFREASNELGSVVDKSF